MHVIVHVQYYYVRQSLILYYAYEIHYLILDFDFTLIGRKINQYGLSTRSKFGFA